LPPKINVMRFFETSGYVYPEVQSKVPGNLNLQHRIFNYFVLLKKAPGVVQ
jgi:hypothetical protein